MSDKPSILILCTGNSCRSHMAEGILRQAAGDFIDVQSAGSNPAGYVHPKAIEVMKEIGIDISTHTSKHMNEFLDREVDTVIAVCGNADQACPMFPGQVNRYHWGFDDPGPCQRNARRDQRGVSSRAGSDPAGLRGLCRRLASRRRQERGA